jgi:hypothetical protein
MWPFFVGAGQIQPSAGRPAVSHRASSKALTRGVSGSSRLPEWGKEVPGAGVLSVTACFRQLRE